MGVTVRTHTYMERPIISDISASNKAFLVLYMNLAEDLACLWVGNLTNTAY
jgi:hypothetical protein